MKKGYPSRVRVEGGIDGKGQSGIWAGAESSKNSNVYAEKLQRGLTDPLTDQSIDGPT